jgi:hypothetical protein
MGGVPAGTGKQEHQRPLHRMTHGNGKPLRRTNLGDRMPKRIEHHKRWAICNIKTILIVITRRRIGESLAVSAYYQESDLISSIVCSMVSFIAAVFFRSSF